MSGCIEPVIHITDTDGSYRTIDLEKVNRKYLKENSPNQRLLHEELKNYLRQGFKITSHIKGNSELPLWYEDYILYKE